MTASTSSASAESCTLSAAAKRAKGEQSLAVLSADLDSGCVESPGDALPLNTKLSDKQIRELRERRAASVAAGSPIAWEVLAADYGGVHWKTAYRVCLGFTRLSAGGPIEPRQIVDPATQLVRCGCCGGMHDRQTGCVLCQGRWFAGLSRVLKRANILN